MKLPLYLSTTFAFLWFWSGIQPLFFARQTSLDLLASVGVADGIAMPVFCLASLVDVALGLWLLIKPNRWCWAVQAVLVVVYSAIIAFRLPEMWHHPFAPLVKNLPLLVVMVYFYLNTQEVQS